MTSSDARLAGIMRALREGLPALADSDPRDSVLVAVVLAAAAAYALGVRPPRAVSDHAGHVWRRGSEWLDPPRGQVVDVVPRITRSP